ncbi:FecR family protein [Novosphingobium terrae]|uniref:FecR family protein n=1 Tax=Novosphingobium terrae TaxID=2726189 RepID=UPI00197D0067|nr:FecR domain-containing protein [Novosphingobium terrae]
MPNPEPTPQMVEQAAQWLAHLESGEASPADQTDYQVWHDAHPAHALAIRRMSGFAARLDSHKPVARETLRQMFLRPKRQLGGTLLGLCLLAGTGLLAWHALPHELWLADHRTPVGVTRSVPLADNSRITLSTDSAVDVDERHDQRRIRLLQGEVLAVVTEQRHAPFVVVTSDGTAEAMGTQFTVSKSAEGTQVTVIRSHVRACPTGAEPSACLILAPGQSVRLANGRATRLGDVAPGDAAAWSEGWLPVEDRPLADVLGDFNRWRTSPLRFDRADLAGLRVSGIFPLRDTDRALGNLVLSQPILVDRSDPQAIRIRRRPAQSQ